METTFSAGQTCGITGIPPKTIQRYIRTFRQFFTDGASQRKQGRRFTDEDIKLLIKIRNYYFEQLSETRIREALANKDPGPQQKLYDFRETFALVRVVAARVEQIEQLVEKQNQSEQRMASVVMRASYLNKTFTDIIQLRQEERYLVVRVENIEKRLTVIEKNISELAKQLQYRNTW